MPPTLLPEKPERVAVSVTEPPASIGPGGVREVLTVGVAMPTVMTSFSPELPQGVVYGA